MEKTWLHDAVVYEIYPQSFYDTNGDGIGDLKGIIEKLDYIQSLGFTAIWLNPINDSSFRDAGYDVSDFYKIAPRYGTNEDYKALCDAVHARGMRIIFDLVAGHTSIEHPWFVESCKAEENEYTNRYIWTDSLFGCSEPRSLPAIGERDSRFIYNFYWCQPALNYGYAHPDPNKPWQKPMTHPDCVATKEELKKIIAYWMDMGVDAFRVDMAPSVIKGDFEFKFVKIFWHEIRAFMQEKNPECLLIAEWGEPSDAVNTGFHLDFLLHSGPKAYTRLFRAEKGRCISDEHLGHSYFNKDGKGNINDYLDRYLYDLERIDKRGYIGMITGNHDMQRLAYRRTPEEVKAAMVFLFTMPGVPFVYYGDEIGMDFLENMPSKEGAGIRAGARTPMQWNDKKNHGFSESDTPYLPTDTREGAPTVEKQMNDPDSMLSFTKQLVALRKETKALSPFADLNILVPNYPFVFERELDGQKVLVAINPSDQRRICDVPSCKKVLLSQNVEFKNGIAFMGGVSFLIAEI